MKHVLIILSLLMFSAETFAAKYSYSSDKGMTFQWVKDNVICAYTNQGNRIRFWATEDKLNSSSFTGYGFAIVNNTQYNAYSPYNSDYVTNGNPFTALPIKYIDQTQTANDNTQHLGAYDYMTAQATSSATACHFNFSHLGSIIRFEITIPEDITPSALTLSSTDDDLLTAGTMNVTNSIITPTAMAEAITLNLQDIEITAGESLIAYMMVAPADLSARQLTVTLSSADGRQATMTVSGTDIQPSRCYTVALESPFLQKTSAPQTAKAITSMAKKTNQPAQTTASILYPTAYAPDFTLDDANPMEQQFILGDINNDGLVMVNDAVMLINHYLSGTADMLSHKVADVNFDGIITVADAVAIVNIYLNNKQ